MMSYSNSLPFREAGSLISFTVTGLQDYDPLLASPHRHHRFSAASGHDDRTLGNQSGRATLCRVESRVYELRRLSLSPALSAPACAGRSVASRDPVAPRVRPPRTRESAARGCLACSTRRVAADQRWNIHWGSSPRSSPTLCRFRTARGHPGTHPWPTPLLAPLLGGSSTPWLQDASG